MMLKKFAAIIFGLMMFGASVSWVLEIIRNWQLHEQWPALNVVAIIGLGICLLGILFSVRLIRTTDEW